MTQTKPLAFDLLYQLESILQSDPFIDEVGFIHPSQFIALSESSGTRSLHSLRTAGQSGDEIVESLLSEVNPSDMVFWSKDHKLGISTEALHSLYKAAKHAFVASREQYKMPNNSYAAKGGHEIMNVSSCSSSSVDSVESDVMKHSRALLLLSSDFGTAWNSRKEIVAKKQQLLLYVDELFLSELVLSYAPKSEPAWSHRRWAIKMIAGKCSNLQEIVEKESELVERLAEKSKMNYRAWNHRCWLVSYMSESQVLNEMVRYRDWAGLHVADNSCFHYRTRLMLRMLEGSQHNQGTNACADRKVELRKVWKDELDWDAMLIRRYIGREALWLYRRFLSLCWIKHFAQDASNVSDHPSHSIKIGIDLFMDDELQFVRSCKTITDDIFEDYESQVKFSATYFLWLMKQMHECAGVEPGEKMGQEVEAILNKICPEKAFLWAFLRMRELP